MLIEMTSKPKGKLICNCGHNKAEHASGKNACGGRTDNPNGTWSFCKCMKFEMKHKTPTIKEACEDTFNRIYSGNNKKMLDNMGKETKTPKEKICECGRAEGYHENMRICGRGCSEFKEAKTPQKFPPEKGLRPSLHPTDDEIIELNDEIYTANLDDQDKTAILLYRTAFEAGQKSKGEETLSLLEPEERIVVTDDATYTLAENELKNRRNAVVSLLKAELSK